MKGLSQLEVGSAALFMIIIVFAQTTLVPSFDHDSNLKKASKVFVASLQVDEPIGVGGSLYLTILPLRGVLTAAHK